MHGEGLDHAFPGYNLAKEKLTMAIKSGTDILPRKGINCPDERTTKRLFRMLCRLLVRYFLLIRPRLLCMVRVWIMI
jgi:hypothetical protein